MSGERVISRSPKTITSAELAASLTCRGERTTVEQARSFLQAFAAQAIVEPVRPDVWRLTQRGVEVTAGLRGVETELHGGAA